MESAVLDEVRNQIETLYADRGSDFTPSPRYEALLTLESRLLAQLRARHLSTA
jgi:hypothetical protein